MAAPPGAAISFLPERETPEIGLQRMARESYPQGWSAIEAHLWEDQMITLLKDLPANVIGLEASGKVTGKDYETTIVPTIEQKQKQFEKVRLLYVLGEGFDGYEVGAAWDDVRLAFRRPGSWEKIAVVSDEAWIDRAAGLFSWIIPGDVKVFANREIEQAKSWVCN